MYTLDKALPSLLTAPFITATLLLGACSSDRVAQDPASSQDPKPQTGLVLQAKPTEQAKPSEQEDSNETDLIGETEPQTETRLEEVVVTDAVTANQPSGQILSKSKERKLADLRRPNTLPSVQVNAHKRVQNIQGPSVQLYAEQAQMPQVASSHVLAAPARTDLSGIRYPSEVTDRDQYQQQEDNPVKLVSEDPVSTFSIDVDTAAYSNVRRMIMREGRLPPRDAVKAEEFINYFSYQYPMPGNSKVPFSIHTEMAPTPWNANTQLLQVGLKGYEPTQEQRPASNLVFLIDVSGSMQSPYKLELVKKSLRMLVNQMNSNDRIALAVYAGAAGMVLDSTAGNQKATIMNAIDSLSAGGSTNGGAGIRLAYNLAQQHFIKDGINRVIIASDGDMNVGTVSREALKDLIKEKRELGISLTTLGFGTGNYNYALMEQMADVGNGNAAYIDSLKEAHKVLVKEMQSTLHTIAKDVKIQVEFNPELVAEYRLIGYENRLLNREDFKNDKVDAGDIGAGHTVTALYEIALKNSGGEQVDPLRYGKGPAHSETFISRTSRPSQLSQQRELAFVKLRYKQPNGAVSTEVTQPVLSREIKSELSQATSELQFAAAVAGYAQLLRGGKFTGGWDYTQAIKLARAGKGADHNGYRGEFITLVELSEGLSEGLSQSLNGKLTARPEH